MSKPTSHPKPASLSEILTDPNSPVVVEESASGVDAAQIRALLAKTPLERLDWLEEFLEDVEELRGSRAR